MIDYLYLLLMCGNQAKSFPITAWSNNIEHHHAIIVTWLFWTTARFSEKDDTLQATHAQQFIFQSWLCCCSTCPHVGIARLIIHLNLPSQEACMVSIIEWLCEWVRSQVNTCRVVSQGLSVNIAEQWWDELQHRVEVHTDCHGISTMKHWQLQQLYMWFRSSGKSSRGVGRNHTEDHLITEWLAGKEVCPLRLGGRSDWCPGWLDSVSGATCMQEWAAQWCFWTAAT